MSEWYPSYKLARFFTSQRSSRGNEAQPSGVRLKDSGRYLDCARIGNCAAVFFHYALGVELEFTLRPAEEVEKKDLALLLVIFNVRPLSSGELFFF